MIIDAKNPVSTPKNVIGAQTSAKTSKQLKLDERFGASNLPGHATDSLANYFVNGRATIHSLLLLGFTLLAVILVGGGIVINGQLETIADHPENDVYLLLGGLSILITVVFAVVALKVAGAVIVLGLAAEPSPILQAIASVAIFAFLLTLETHKPFFRFGTVWEMIISPFVLLIVGKVLIGLTFVTSIVQIATRTLRQPN